MKKKATITIAIIAKNEEEMIGPAIKSGLWADEVLVLDTGSTDRTVEIAQKLGARVVSVPTKGLAFSAWRKAVIRKTKSDWLFYLDADERVTPGLKKEVLSLVGKAGQPGRFSAYAIPRANYYLGQRFKHGGSWPDYVKRLFWKKNLKGWSGRLHEEPEFEGELGHLKNPIEHYTHRDITLMTQKTIRWSVLEAQNLLQAGHPPMAWWRFFRVMLTEFWERGIKKKGLLDGTAGTIEVIFQMFSRFITYARLWELQQKEKKR